MDEKTLNLFSATVLGSYFQDRFSTVYYIIVVGDNGTVKSAIADTFAALGYGVVVMTNPTKAIWYRVLGNVEHGQVTIIADESEGIEQSLEIMNILKDGYQKKHKVPRMDSDNQKPEWYYPFCVKIIICEGHQQNTKKDY
jgi:HSP90 family molecular chaperone